MIVVEFIADSGLFTLRAPYDIYEACKAIKGRRWQSEARRWVYPATPATAARIREAFNGQIQTCPEFDAMLAEAAIPESRKLGPDYDTPIPVTRTTPMPHQVRGYNLIAKRTACMLGWRMGVGKTKSCIDVIVNLKPLRTLIQCPKAVVRVWQDEFDKHGDGNAVVLALDSGATYDRRNQIIKAFAAHKDRPVVVVLNYEAAWRGELGEFLMAQLWDLAVCDESHHVKAPGGTASRFCARLRARSAKRVCLTGTPLAHSPLDIYGQFRFLDPGVFGTSFTRFRNEYCNPLEAPIWMSDLSFKPIGDISPGEKVIGWIRNDRESKRRRMVESEVKAVGRRTGFVVCVRFESGRTLRCTPHHKWLSAYHGAGQADLWVQTGNSTKKRMPVLSHVITPTVELNNSILQRKADWLAGMFDGEGWSTHIAHDANHNPATCARLREVLTELKIPFRQDHKAFYMLGGRQTFVDFINWTRPVLVKTTSMISAVYGGAYTPKGPRGGGNEKRYGGLNRHPDRIVSVSPDGFEDVVSLETETGNYICWGYASKNCIMGGYGNYEVKGYRNQDAFRRKFYSMAYVVTEDEVLTLPPAVHQERYIELSDEARRVYNALDRDFVAEFADGKVLTAANVLSRLLRLQQITGGCLPSDDEGGITAIDDGKRSEVVDLLDEIPDEPLVVFCRFRYDIAAVRAACEKAGRAVRELSGVKNQLAEWQADAGPSVLVTQIQSGSEGVSMVRARYAIFYSLGFSLSQYEQALARLRRKGQERSVTYIHLVASKTVDEKVYRALREHKDVVEYILETVMEKRDASLPEV